VPAVTAKDIVIEVCAKLGMAARRHVAEFRGAPSRPHEGGADDESANVDEFGSGAGSMVRPDDTDLSTGRTANSRRRTSLPSRNLKTDERRRPFDQSIFLDASMRRTMVTYGTNHGMGDADSRGTIPPNRTRRRLVPGASRRGSRSSANPSGRPFSSAVHELADCRTSRPPPSVMKGRRR